jgi:hypothetical protein
VLRLLGEIEVSLDNAQERIYGMKRIMMKIRSVRKDSEQSESSNKRAKRSRKKGMGRSRQ